MHRKLMLLVKKIANVKSLFLRFQANFILTQRDRDVATHLVRK